jgi:hypothetical protein
MRAFSTILLVTAVGCSNDTARMAGKACSAEHLCPADLTCRMALGAASGVCVDSQCAETSDCGSDELCSVGRCVVLCNVDDDCAAGLPCEAGICRTCNDDDTGQCLTEGLVDARLYGGSCSDETLLAAITAIGGAARTLYLAPCTWSITKDLIVPANINLKVENGALLSIADAVSFTISGTLEAGLYGIFSTSGSGRVLFGGAAIESIYAEWWGADGGDDDSTAIQAALDSCASSKRALTLKGARSSYAVASGLTMDVAYTTWDLNGARLLAFGMTSGTVISMYASASLVHQGARGLFNADIYGPGKTSSVTGIRLASVAATPLYGFKLDNIRVFACGTGITYGAYSFNFVHYNTNIFQCGTGVKVEQGANVTGVIYWYGGQIGGCDLALDVQDMTFSSFLNMDGMSFDNNTRLILATNGYLYLINCKFEGNVLPTADHGGIPYADPPVVLGPMGHLTMIGGYILCHDSLAATGVSHFFQVDTNDNQTGLVLDGVAIDQTVTTSGELCTGNGTMMTSNIYSPWGGAYFENNLLHATQGNLLSDGGFEEPEVYDAFIYNDNGVAIDSRTQGTNIDIGLVEAAGSHSGSQYLKATKSAGYVGFALMAPVHGLNRFYGSRLWYKKPGAQTGRMYFVGRYVQVLYSDANGLPVIGKTEVPNGSLDAVDFTASPVDWTSWTSHVPFTTRPPNWATHYQILISLNDTAPGDYYFDDAIISSY